MIRNELGLYNALETILKKAGRPMTCNELYDLPDVRKLASDVNRVSDYLGNLWRKGLLMRLPAPKSANSATRWCYQWKQPAIDGHNRRRADDPSKTPRAILSKPSIEVIDGGNVVTIELPSLTITIRVKT